VEEGKEYEQEVLEERSQRLEKEKAMGRGREGRGWGREERDAAKEIMWRISRNKKQRG
jgi:hypothetical protein